MAANVELEFFAPEDMDVLLPGSYYDEARNYRYRRVFRAPLFLSGAFFIIGLATLPIESDARTIGALVFAVMLVCSLFIENRRCSREYAHLVKHAPGRGRTIGENGRNSCAP